MREVNYPQSLNAGNLVKLEIDHTSKQDLEFSTCGSDHETITLWESIDLKTFPSCNDFHGGTIQVPIGTVAIVLAPVGIPDYVFLYLSLRPEEAPSTHRLIRNDLTVYDILVHGRKYQAFGCDMKIKRDK